MSYSKNYYALRNPTEDKRILDYNNNMMMKQIAHEKNELNKRLNKTKANVRFMGNGKSSIDTLISKDMESDKPLGNRVMGSGKIDECHCMMDKDHKKGKGKKAVKIDDIMNMEEKEMKGKGRAERMTKKGGMKSINLDLDMLGGMKMKGRGDKDVEMSEEEDDELSEIFSNMAVKPQETRAERSVKFKNQGDRARQQSRIFKKEEKEEEEKPQKRKTNSPPQKTTKREKSQTPPPKMKGEGKKKPNKWIEFVNKTRKETGKSLKDTLKHIKQNNLYKKE